MSHINVEIKARCDSPVRIQRLLFVEKEGISKGIDHQIDTYFEVASGRLKLRQGTIENYLIHYERNDQFGPKLSVVSLVKLTHEQTDPMKVLLEKSGLKTKVVVDKIRAIYFIDNVKFHIDEVVGLGSFVEIEAIDLDGSIGQAGLLSQCEEYMEYLGIQKADLISNSYSDLLGAKDDS